MSSLKVKDIMHPRLSVPSKDRGEIVVNRLMCMHPALPVVNDQDQVVGIVSEFDVIDALTHSARTHEFSAESVMSCGHEEHMTVCQEPLTIEAGADADEALNLFKTKNISVLPVVESRESRKLIGIVSRKSLIYALSEQHFWPEHEYNYHKV